MQKVEKDQRQPKSHKMVIMGDLCNLHINWSNVTMGKG